VAVQGSVEALLAQAKIDQREAQMLLANLLGVSRASLLAHAERQVDDAVLTEATALFSRRAKGEPVAYLLGTREFYGRDFKVSPATLVPRPETETLVEQALARLSEQLSAGRLANAGVSHETCIATNAGVDCPPRVLDLGTGSGAIAISLALERPDAHFTACDISHDALAIAIENATHLNAKVEFILSDWYANLGTRRFNLIVANPPYVAAGDVHLTQGDLRFEPACALTDESADGLGAIGTIIEHAAAHLQPRGWLLFEHGFDQAEACRALLLKAGFINLSSIPDLAGISRVAGGQTR
jgi:release factor glutamine methyltransferase